MGYWKSKVLPKIKKVFEKNPSKKAAAAEATKSFDDSKEEYNKVFEEKKTELHTKVVEIYEASPTEIKSLVKERNEGGLKKNTTQVHKFLEELVKIDFPGSKAASEASSKFGPTLASSSVFFVFEKVSTFVVTEEKEEKGETKTEETSSSVVQEREIVVEEEKKEDEKAQVIETSGEKKVEEQAAEAAAKEEEKSTEAADQKEEPAKA
ncbi:plasma membrane-associated cation-binding protein 1 [Vigna radiata var. radiata]|uniref:Plasma membrane-associated cation-binding protein 1 n=1 Tax=Vigna radiata var. radiata TaxID=3916 RepID=A0A1S3U1M0_VIGRR|nr:plasma membrane-associated cation-binding protein 1 [Vigna radiata var. radiata]